MCTSSMPRPSPEDMLIQITHPQSRARSRPVACVADALVPQYMVMGTGTAEAGAARTDRSQECDIVKATHAELGERYFYCDGRRTPSFTDNETNTQRIFERFPTLAIRQRRHQRLCSFTASRGRGESRQERHQSGGALSIHHGKAGGAW